MAPVALVLLSACGGGVTPAIDAAVLPDLARPPKPFSYPLDGVLRLNDVQVKSTHNSYHVEKPNNTLPDWDYTHAPLDVQLEAQGVRHFEIDLQYNRELGLEVFHVPAADDLTTCQRFVECLVVIKAWSDRFPGHVPIGVQMEAKGGFLPSVMDAAVALVESDILSVFPRDRLITPDDVKGDSATLEEGVRARGWPTLGTVRGRVYFAWNETGELRTRYTHGLRDLDGRLIFVESSPGQPFGAYAIINNATRTAEIEAALAAGFVVRTFAEGTLGPDGADLAWPSNANFVSTDFPAQVAGRDAWLDNPPGGTPARCNPKTAPEACTSRAIEDPAFVGGD